MKSNVVANERTFMSNNSHGYCNYSVRDLRDFFREGGTGGGNLDRDKDLV